MRTLSIAGGRGADLRLVMTADAVGGVWTYALDLAGGLARHGTATTLAVAGPPPSADQLAEAAKVPGLALEQVDAPLDWLADGPLAVRHAAEAVAALAGKARADVVQLNSPALAASVRFPAPVVAVCHSCVSTWWQAVRGSMHPLPEDFRWRTQLTRAGLARADAIVAPSHAFAAAVTQTYRLLRPPRVVHNGRAAGAGSAECRPVTPAPFAFTAGRLWDEGKNAALLDRAAAALPFPVFAAGPVAGPSGTGPPLHRLRLLDRLPSRELQRWLGMRPIFVAPSLYEPFGLAVLEAAGAGAPLLLSDIATFRELWDGAAVFFDPHDAGTLARKLRDLASDAGLRHALGVAARRRASRYALDRMADAMAATYRSLLQPQSAASAPPPLVSEAAA